jgi:DNA-3-methyladenine glycosylase I
MDGIAYYSPRMPRCPWAKGEKYERYHDEEWGVPIREDLGRAGKNGLFEFLILEGAQAGLSWATILNKREAYREAFDGFDPERIARFTPARVEKLLTSSGPSTVVRNRLKVNAAVINARAYLALSEEIGGRHPLAKLLWSFPDPTGEQRPIQNRWTGAANSRVPATTPISDAMSKVLAKRGFKFVGSTIMYAFMQATGMVNDHLTTCPRHAVLARTSRTAR